MLKVKRALISVSDKTGIVDFARVLTTFGVEIISTGGTAKTLREAGMTVMEMSDYTGFPEMLDGRVKTLHPKIHGGLLSLRSNPEHMATVARHGIGLIDMVVVNLYPFEKTVAKPGVALEEAIENIDIGGPSMLRSAAKNYHSVAVVCDPAYYPRLTDLLRENQGSLPPEILAELAAAVFRRTAAYDGAIAAYLSPRFAPSEIPAAMPESVIFSLSRRASLRYGENPHQKAAVYALAGAGAGSLLEARQLHGKELSFNNYLDLNAAWEIVRAFPEPAACVIKHTNPCGVASAASLSTAFKDAFRTDPLSAFGGIIGLNRPVDRATAREIAASGFMECIIAPSFSPEAVSLLGEKKNLRLMEMPAGGAAGLGIDVKLISGGFLIQQEDGEDAPPEEWRVVTRKKPTKTQLAALVFGWKVVRFVKSNAIVLAKGTKTVGIGMGQTSRVDSVHLAIKRAGERADGSVLASDAFFPKADNVELAREAGVTAIIQPGGSVADGEAIAAADEAGIAMLFTGMRHFRH
jgi:phosphoribosylaminoimidazolecarboxamide formyltransferase/IMP cyclohydrolase